MTARGGRACRRIPEIYRYCRYGVFASEAEFFVFEDVRYQVEPNSVFYTIDSDEAYWNTSRKEEGGNLGNKTPVKGGYFPVSPVDKASRSA